MRWYNWSLIRRGGEMVDTRDLKSRDSNIMRVRVPPAAPVFRLLANRNITFRGIAQMARARGLGPRGRRFEPCFPDIIKKSDQTVVFFISLAKTSAFEGGGLLVYQS